MNDFQPCEYHIGGKTRLATSTPLKDQKDLSLAYTPGVAKPCLAIEKDPTFIDSYTSKSNLVAVMTDGTAVLGLGDIGAAASIPVMEGKCLLFKTFAGVDAWPVPFENVRVNGMTGPTDPKKFIEAAKTVAILYGGINLEDIAAPACFEIEDTLDAILDIPVFHDDQWGTAIITLAAVTNYLFLTHKKMETVQIVINGAGAAGMRIAEMLSADGAKKITIVDSKGVIHSEREDINRWKRKFAYPTPKRTLADAMKGADIFIGVSVAECVSREMVASMANAPAIFAMANPTPEISPEEVKLALGDKVHYMATGRSDYPNQINNVLGFPYIFKGALMVGAKTITTNMKIAAAKSLSALARVTEIPENVKEAYGDRTFEFGVNYLIPTPFDPRIREVESNAVATAALHDGVSRYQKDISSLPTLPYTEKVTYNEVVYFQNHTYLVIENIDQKFKIAIDDALEITLPSGKTEQFSPTHLCLTEIFKRLSVFKACNIKIGLTTEEKGENTVVTKIF